MINHARCLLLNSNPVDRPVLGMFGEEYIPSDYRVLDYDDSMRAIRTALLGVAEDPLFQNYRLAQLMACMHGNPYTLQQILGLDARFTYRPFEVVPAEFGQAVMVEPINEFTMQCGVVGTPAADERSGRCTFRYTVKTAAGPALEILDYATNSWRVEDLVLVGELSEPVKLNQSLDLTLTVPLGSWVTDAMWTVTAVALSTQDLGAALQNAASLPAAVATMSRDASPSYQQLWRYGISVLDQMAGLLGMFVERAERIRLA
jgi:hypothetical protein